MSAISPSNDPRTRQGFPALLIKMVAISIASAAAVLWASPPIALAAGVLFALLLGNPFGPWSHRVTKWLLQTCVVLLGFGTNLSAAIRLGLHGSAFAACSIAATLFLGWRLGRKLRLDDKTTALISAGTAICGGSAIAAVSSVIAATDAEIAVSIGTIFVLNGIALYLYPLIGHCLHLSQDQFGLWAGIGIHDISSVVGAGLSYGPKALATATAVKLARTLWIIPLTLGIAIRLGQKKAATADGQPNRSLKLKVTIPWFIGFFLLAAMFRSYTPEIVTWSPIIATIAQHGMTLALFLVGTSLSQDALRLIGWRTVIAGLTLWVFISTATLFSILFLQMH